MADLLESWPSQSALLRAFERVQKRTSSLWPSCAMLHSFTTSSPPLNPSISFEPAVRFLLFLHKDTLHEPSCKMCPYECRSRHSMMRYSLICFTPFLHVPLFITWPFHVRFGRFISRWKAIVHSFLSVYPSSQTDHRKKQ